ncbi:MAG: N-acetylated-alpha-linked acidic dipeptidase [Myxococcota bacterium]|jgi:N-acetylated-alpha-linked acidic dipeptidase
MLIQLPLLLSFLAGISQQLPTDISPSTVRLGETLNTLCEQPRFAGDPRSQHAIDYMASELEKHGWEVELKYYWAHLPRQTYESLQIYSANKNWIELDLKEQGFKDDVRTQNSHIPPMHGLTGDGKAQGAVWYVGYGTRDEFLQLQKRFGDDFKGGIALMRYGANYRGIKIANAEEFGFSGALLYTDADDDGFTRGAVLPDGPFRPSTGIQRGSVFNGNGDALTPGWAATKDAPRLSIDEAPGLVKIPSLPISSANAGKIISAHGKKLGNTTTQVKIEVRQDKSLQKICNVVATLKGSTADHEWVIFGAHRDAWGRGATDNGTGSTVLLESARVIGKAYQQGWRPQRRMIIASWDAEEWGLVGSTEWVEEHRDDLIEHAIAYVNLDVAATGPNFSASCTPGLEATLTSSTVANDVKTPRKLGVPGGGSDHVPFIEIAGIESMAFGFHGGSGVYHSALDTPYLVEKFLDPGYIYHAQAAKLAIDVATRLSSASEIIDGRRSWLVQMLAAIEKTAPSEYFSTEQRAALNQLLSNAAAQLPSQPQAEGYKFHRSFLAKSGRSMLWNSSGYGATWFPGLSREGGAEKLISILKKHILPE